MTSLELTQRECELLMFMIAIAAQREEQPEIKQAMIELSIKMAKADPQLKAAMREVTSRIINQSLRRLDPDNEGFSGRDERKDFQK